MSWAFEPSSLGYRGMRRPRCTGCRLARERCLCGELEEVACATPVTLFVHSHELSRPSNTAWLVARMIASSRVVVHGGRGARGGLSRDAQRWLALSPDGRPLRPDDAGAGLLVADGTWSQVRRMNHRIAALRDADHVRLEVPASVPPVRRGDRPDRLCTAEAVARALGILGERAAEDRLLDALGRWAERTIDGRRAG